MEGVVNAPAAITIATATALAIAWAVPAQGVALSTRLYQGHAIIDVVGAFEPGDSDRFMATVEATPRATMVVFDSGGGQISEGEAIGAIIENHHLATGVAAGGQCSSACVLAWAAGSRKSIAPDASIGVHNASAAEMNEDDVAQRLDGISATSQMGKWLRRFGAPDNVVNKVLDTPPERMYWLSAKDLAGWQVTVTGVPHAPDADLAPLLPATNLLNKLGISPAEAD